MRINLEFKEVSEIVKNSDFKVFSTPANSETGRVVALKVDGAGKKLSRKEIDGYTNFVGNYGAKGLLILK